MRKKKGFSLIEVLAALVILVIFSLLLFSLVMQSGKGEITNKGTINETQVMSGVTSALFTENSSYFRENLGATLSNVEGGERFVIEGTDLSSIINVLQNNINKNQYVYGNGKDIKYIVVLKPGMLDTNLWGCKVTLYTLKEPSNIETNNLESIINYGEKEGQVDVKNIIRYFNEKPKVNEPIQDNVSRKTKFNPNTQTEPNSTWYHNKNIWNGNGYWFCNYGGKQWILYNGTWRQVYIENWYYDINIDGTWYKVWK